MRRKNIIIEIDGGQHNLDVNIIKDEERTKFLESKGYKVIRFWNNDINNNLDGVYQQLMDYINL